MKTKPEPHNGLLTFVVPGDLISTTAEPLREEITALLEDTAKPATAWHTFRLDLTHAKMVDSVGLNFIVTILKSVQKHGAKMQVVYGNQNVQRTLLFTRLDKHLELVSGLAA